MHPTPAVAVTVVNECRKECKVCDSALGEAVPYNSVLHMHLLTVNSVGLQHSVPVLIDM